VSSPTRDDLLDQIDRMRIALQDIEKLALAFAVNARELGSHFDAGDGAHSVATICGNEARAIAAMCSAALEAK
jgi:hypothetical protein